MTWRLETRDVVAGLSFCLVLDVSSISAVLVISECGRLVKAQYVRLTSRRQLLGTCRPSSELLLPVTLRAQDTALAPADLLIQTCTQLWLPNQLHG